MNTLAIRKTLVTAASLLTVVCCDAKEPSKEFMEVDGPNVRIMRHEDGSSTRFTRTPDNRTLTKRKFSANGVLTMLTIYRMDTNGNPVSCKIHDGNNDLLYKVSYGYRKTDGQLVEERMFDARVKRKDPNTGVEMPIQRICYVYDAQGNRSAPIVINLLPGKMFEEVFGEKSTAPGADPFNTSPKTLPVNPSAKPVGR